MENIFIDEKTTRNIVETLKRQKDYRGKIKMAEATLATKHHDELLNELSAPSLLNQVDRLCLIARTATDCGLDVSAFAAGASSDAGNYVGFISDNAIGYYISANIRFVIATKPDVVNSRQAARIGPFTARQQIFTWPTTEEMEKFLADWPAFKKRFMDFITSSCAEIDAKI